MDASRYLECLAADYGDLRAQFRAHEPGEEVPTWFGPDQTVAFWIRRMAQETVIHRVDAELAARLPVTGIPADLARCCAGCGAGSATTPCGWPAIPPGRITCGACSPWSPGKALTRTRNRPPAGCVEVA